MSLFDPPVETTLRGQTGLAALRPVVVTELLHQDILRELSVAGLLKCLAFTGGSDFDRHSLNDLADVSVSQLQKKYGLPLHCDRITSRIVIYGISLRCISKKQNCLLT